MIKPTTPRPPRRRNADYRWTEAKAIAFLRGIAAHGSVARAAGAVGMSRNSAYRLRERLGPGFAALWDKAVRLGRFGLLEDPAAPSPGEAGRHKVTPGGGR